MTLLTGLRRQATAAEVIDLALAELASTTAPPYLFLNLMDVHKPYPAAAEISSKENRAFLFDLTRLLAGLGEPEDFDREHVEWARRSYLAQVTELDRELGRLFGALRQMGLYDDALIVVTSDHGEAFFDNPDLPLYYDHHGAYEAAVRIPLVIKRSGRSKGRRFEHLVEQAEIAPALLALAARETPGGQSLYDEGRRRPIVTEWNPHPSPGAMSTLPLPRAALYRDDLKLVVEGDWRAAPVVGQLGVSLFDLEQSPFESTEVGSRLPRLTAELRTELLELLSEEWAAAADQIESQEPDPRLLETLRSLGYIE